MIRITKNSIVYYPFSPNSENIFIEDKDIINFLSDEIRIGKNVTFERIFDLIILNKDILNIVFDGGTLKGFRIDNYIEEYNKTDKSESDDDINYLEIFWGVDYMEYKNGSKELTSYSGLHGIDENYTDKFQKTPCKMSLALDFTPIYKLKKCLFKLNNNFQVRGYKPNDKEKFPIILDCEKNFTLFDVINAILHEISFHGTPKMRQEQADDLELRVESIKNGDVELTELIIDDDKIKFYDKDGNLKDLFDVDDEDDSDSCCSDGVCDCIDDD